MIETNLVRLAMQRETMIAYLKVKLNQEDWHGVCDAANDLRDLEVAIAYSKELEEYVIRT